MLKVGRDIERYRVEAILGRGGAGTVYGVRHRTLGTVHALKVLHIASPVMRARFIEEGRIQARLRHENIVHVSDVLDVQGHPGLLMDCVTGGSLLDRLRVAPVHLSDVVRWGCDTVSGVAHAHAQRVTHRDLKPANILLTTATMDRRAIARVTDFGLARVLGGGHPSLTQMGSMLGTPAYMAPEQVEDPRSVDERADIFSLGVLLYEVSTGARPFEGDDHGQIFAAARSGHYRPPGERVPALPSDLQDLIIRCMAPDRNGRPDSCAELLSVLRSIAASEGPQDRPLWTPPPLERGQPSAPPADQHPDTLASLVSHGDGPAHGNMAEQVPAAQTLANWGRNDPTPRVEQLPPWPAGFGTRREDAEPPQAAPPPNVPPETPPVAARRGAPGGDAPQEPTTRVWRRGGGWRAGLLLLPLLAATLSWTGNADARLTWWILDAYRAPVVADDVGLIAISVDDPIALRPDYPGMLRALRDAGVRAVVFDVALTRPSPHDAAIAEAIDELDDAGVPVVFPIRFSGSDAEPPASPEIREAATLGLVESSRGSGAGLVYQLESRRFLPDSATVWHLALHGAAAAQGLGPDEIAVEGDDLQVGEHRVPAPGRLLWLTPTTAPRYVPHDAPDRFPELEGRVAFVGAHGRNRDEFLTPAGIRYGVEIIAMMTQAILSEAIPRRLGTGADVLAALLAGLMSLVAGGQRKWLGWMVAVGLMSVAVAACISGILVALVPLVSAALIGAWAGQGGRPR